jgi:O-methyltransferase
MLNYVSKKLINLGHRLSPTANDLAWVIPDTSADDRRIIEETSRYSSTHPVAQWAFIQAINQIHTNGIPGDIVECGVWKGGNLVLAGLMRKRLGFHRAIWGYDTFEGMTQPNENDVKPGFNVDARAKFQKRKKSDHVEWCYVPLADVERNYRGSVGDLDVKLIKGDVAQTLLIEENLPKQISILRLDTDFHASTKIELEILYPRLASGGVMIIDDYGVWAGSRKAVDEYFQGKLGWLHYVTRGVRLMIKP